MILRKKVVNLNQATLEGFVGRVRRAVKLTGGVNVLVTSSAELKALNRRFCGKNRATDVLSFPAEKSKTSSGPMGGEVAISADIAAQNAAGLGHSTAQEVKILTLHGILHLAGFDHERDDGQMAREEVKLRRRFRLPTGLIERAQLSEVKVRRPPLSRSAKARRTE